MATNESLQEATSRAQKAICLWILQYVLYSIYFQSSQQNKITDAETGLEMSHTSLKCIFISHS